MNKILFIALMLFSVNASAATFGTIMISGTVPASTSIVVTPTAGYNSLDLATTQTNLGVATITEANNTTLGYTVTASSANAGLLKNGTLGSVVYTAKYNSVVFALQVAPVTVTTQGAQTTVVSTIKPLTISYTGIAPASLMQGVYSDTLTFTILAN